MPYSHLIAPYKAFKRRLKGLGQKSKRLLKGPLKAFKGL